MPIGVVTALSRACDHGARIASSITGIRECLPDDDRRHDADRDHDEEEEDQGAEGGSPRILGEAPGSCDRAGSASVLADEHVEQGRELREDQQQQSERDEQKHSDGELRSVRRRDREPEGERDETDAEEEEDPKDRVNPRIVAPMSARPIGGSEKVARKAARVRTTISQGLRKNAKTRLRMTADDVGSGRGVSSSPNQYSMPYVPVHGSTAAITTEITPVIASVRRNQGSQFFAQIRRPAPTMSPTPIDPGATSCHAAGGGATRPRSGRGGTGGGSGCMGPGTLVATRGDHKNERG